MKLEFFDRFSEKAQISNLIKTRLVEAELLQANRHTDRLIDRRTWRSEESILAILRKRLIIEVRDVEFCWKKLNSTLYVVNVVA